MPRCRGVPSCAIAPQAGLTVLGFITSRGRGRVRSWWSAPENPPCYCERRRSCDGASPARLSVPGRLIGHFPTQRGKIERL
jgi:hypothetical protein